MGFDLGVSIAVGFVVALFVASIVMWHLRSNETYDDLLDSDN